MKSKNSIEMQITIEWSESEEEILKYLPLPSDKALPSLDPYPLYL